MRRDLRRTCAVVALAVATVLAACDGQRGGASPAPAGPQSSSPVRDPSGPAPARSSDVAAAPPAADAGPAKLDPLAARDRFVTIDVPGFLSAVVSVPIGARSKRPVVLATHGNYDTPEWQCDVWRGIVGGDVFVLCPRGVPRRDSPAPDDIRFTYENNQTLEREIAAAVAALGERFPDHADLDRIVYTGFSLGAIMGVAIFGRGDGAARYPRAALVEGGHDRWTAASAKKYAEGGGRRVLFGCGQPSCAQAAKRAAAHLEKAGIATRVVHGKNMGHTYDGAVADEVRAAMPWLLEGDDRFVPAR